MVAASEGVNSGNFSDPFRPRYAVDMQLDADENTDSCLQRRSAASANGR